MPELQTVTIDGKTGTVAYFDAQMRMTTAAKAIAAKVVFDDGSHLWLTR